MYGISHFNSKSIFAHIGEFGLRSDRKDFATNSYALDEEQHRRTASKAGGRKEEEEENVAACGTSWGTNDDPFINLSNDEDNDRAGGSEAPLTGAQLTSPVVDVEVLVRKRNVITPRSLFIDDPVVQRVDPTSPRSPMETRRAKKARQSCAGFVVGASSSATTKDSQSLRMQSLEQRLDKLTESSLQMQIVLQ